MKKLLLLIAAAGMLTSCKKEKCEVWYYSEHTYVDGEPVHVPPPAHLTYPYYQEVMLCGEDAEGIHSGKEVVISTSGPVVKTRIYELRK